MASIWGPAAGANEWEGVLGHDTSCVHTNGTCSVLPWYAVAHGNVTCCTVLCGALRWYLVMRGGVVRSMVMCCAVVCGGVWWQMVLCRCAVVHASALCGDACWYVLRCNGTGWCIVVTVAAQWWYGGMPYAAVVCGGGSCCQVLHGAFRWYVAVCDGVW